MSSNMPLNWSKAVRAAGSSPDSPRSAAAQIAAQNLPSRSSPATAATRWCGRGLSSTPISPRRRIGVHRPFQAQAVRLPRLARMQSFRPTSARGSKCPSGLPCARRSGQWQRRAQHMKHVRQQRRPASAGTKHQHCLTRPSTWLQYRFVCFRRRLGWGASAWAPENGSGD
jgi:hypothetical protein